MPIPHLTEKIRSPKSWRQKPIKDKKRKRTRYQVSRIVGSSVRQAKPAHKKPKKRFLKRAIKYCFIFGFVGILVGGIGIVAMFAAASKNLPNPGEIIKRNIPESTKIYDRTGKTILYEIHGEEKRTQIKLSDLNKYVIEATIATEDKNFYTHPGFDLKGIFRAAVFDLLRGKKTQGGSTITQQLIKNAILTSEKRFKRKIKELILAYQIEQKFSKDEILEMYFNEIPYGSTAYGIEAAAQTYFSKSAKDLTLAETAILTALPKAPTYYSPYGSHRDELFARAKYVLEQMVKEKYISKETARQTDVEAVKFKPKKESIIAPHFVFYVKELLTEKYGEKMVEQGGLKIITTLDLYKQKKAEEAINAWAKRNLDSYNASNAALVALDPKTGEILAMVGSKDYYNEEIDGNVNVTIRQRQPGSSFKPIVYTAAFKKGYTPETILYDVETVFATAYTSKTEKVYKPRNYDLTEHGPVSMRQALAGSLNIPAVKTLYLTGIDNVLDLAEELGYSTFKDRSRFGLSLVLGGGEVTLLEHAHAFGAFAREGKLAALQSVIKIEDRDGKVIEEFKKPKIKEVIQPKIARLTNSILSDNESRAFIFGSKSYLQLGKRPVAAKTGTTNDYRDAWTIGYTPSIVVGVWVGNNDNSAMKRGAAGGTVAAPIWNTFMHSILDGTPIEYFKEPDTSYLEEINKPILKGELVKEITVEIDKSSLKLATELTPKSQREERTYKQVHSILYFINKDDPRGPAPKDPSVDPEFETWEEGVRQWAKKQGFINEEPPTEYDDVHTKENKPQIFFVSPQNNETLTSRLLYVDITTSAPRGVSKVEYYLNDQRIATVKTPPFDLENFQISNNFLNGSYTLKAISYDDVDNSNSSEIKIHLNAETIPTTINWLLPQNNSSYYASSFPLTLKASISDTFGIQEINFYSKNLETQETKLIYTTYDFLGGTFTAKWGADVIPGKYELYIESVSEEGEKNYSDVLYVTVLE